MTSERQISANRLNAQKSTGPRSRAGKSRSRRNALRHGLTAETVLEHTEDPAEYRAFERGIVADFSPTSTTERALVVRLASLLWRLKRATAMETGLLTKSSALNQPPQTFGSTTLLHCVETTLLTNPDPAAIALKLVTSLISERRDNNLSAEGFNDPDENSGTWQAKAIDLYRAANSSHESLALVLRYQTSLSRQLAQTLIGIAQVRQHTQIGFLVPRRRSRLR